MKVRPRVEADLVACVAAALVVRARDGYPVFMPTDIRDFLAAPDAHAAWVAEEKGLVVGHVALHRRSSAPVMATAAGALGRSEDSLAVVARLFVAVEGRRLGVGRALLAEAAGHARTLGLWPVLDVAVDLLDGIRLYESCGWRRAGAVTVEIADRGSIDEFVYLAPPPPPAAVVV